MNKHSKRTMLLTLAMLVFWLAAYSESRKHINTSTVENFDLKSYMGKWYEIARLDNRFERGMTNVTTEYTLLDDGNVRVVNSGMRDGQMHHITGKAKTTSQSGRLRVSFFMFFFSDYNVLAMGHNGSWALVGSSSPKYLWILAREKSLPADVIDQILEIARSRGYDTNKLIFDKR